MQDRAVQPRFSLRLLLLIMLVLSVLAAAARHLVRSFDPNASRATFILFVIAAPVLLVVAVSLVVGIFRWFSR